MSQGVLIISPKTLETMKFLGIPMEELYFKSKKEYLIENPLIRNEPIEIIDMWYNNWENSRKDKVKLIIDVKI